MEDSILKSTKKILGVMDDDSTFDLDIITHINSALSIVRQVGVGPEDGLFIDSDSATWSDLGLPDDQTSLVRTYVYLNVRMLFDPPATSFLIDAINKQLAEHLNRLSYYQEGYFIPT